MGGQNWSPKKGSFWLLKMSQNRRYSQWYISTPVWRSDSPFYKQSTGSLIETPMPWLSKIFMPLGVVTIQTGSTIAKMAKLAVLGDRPG